MHEFSDSVGLLGSSPDTTFRLRDEELRYKPCEHMVQQNSPNLHTEVIMALVHQQMYFISLLHLLTQSGRFRVGFGVGDIQT